MRRYGFISRVLRSRKTYDRLLSLVLLTTTPSAYAQGFGHGTTAVVIRSPKAILAGVDSKETYSEYRNGQLSVTSNLVCKLTQVGPYYALIAGIARGTNGFDALDEIRHAYQPGDSLAIFTSRLRASIPPRLEPMLTVIRDLDPRQFDRIYLQQTALTITAFGIEAGLPSVAIVDFRANGAPQGPVTLASESMSCPGTCSSPTMAYLSGVHERLDNFLVSNPEILNRPTEDHIREMLEMESQSHPDIVGGPPVLIKIDKYRASVISSGVCSLK
jgi:hypothetical protein